MSMHSRFALAGLALCAAGATAQVVTFTYSDVSGSYNTGTQVFNASAGANTSGDVTRLAAPGGSAQYGTGFTTLLTSADVDLTLTLSNITATTADATGSFTITDDNGDTLTGNIDGEFQGSGFAISFDGLISGAVFNNNSLDGTFDGPTGGSFSTDLNPIPLPLDGAIVQLFFSFNNFFVNSFSNTPVLVDALLIPAPGAASLALAGLGLAAKRRRR